MKIIKKKIGVSIKLCRDFHSYQVSEELEIESDNSLDDIEKIKLLKLEMAQRLIAEAKAEIDSISGLMKLPFNPQTIPVVQQPQQPIIPNGQITLPQ